VQYYLNLLTAVAASTS